MDNSSDATTYEQETDRVEYVHPVAVLDSELQAMTEIMAIVSRFSIPARQRILAYVRDRNSLSEMYGAHAQKVVKV